MRHAIVALVENKPGVLSKLCGLIARKGFNIINLSVADTERPSVTRISMAVETTEPTAPAELAQVVHQLEKQPYVLQVFNLTQADPIARETALFKIAAAPVVRGEVFHTCENFRARVLEAGPDSMVVEITGDHQKIDAFIAAIEKYHIIESIRTGEVFMTKDNHPLLSK